MNTRIIRAVAEQIGPILAYEDDPDAAIARINSGDGWTVTIGIPRTNNDMRHEGVQLNVADLQRAIELAQAGIEA